MAIQISKKLVHIIPPPTFWILDPSLCLPVCKGIVLGACSQILVIMI